MFPGVMMLLNLLAVRLYLAPNCSSQQDVVDLYILIKPLSHFRTSVTPRNFVAGGGQLLTLVGYG
jgi:hypothetical protein